MTENEISAIVLDSAIRIHRDLGPGLFESVYERALASVLEARGLTVRRQAAIPFEYDGQLYEDGFRADLIVNDLVIVEIKSVEEVSAVHYKQVRTYLRLARLRLGLLVNFNGERLVQGFTRIVNQL